MEFALRRMCFAKFVSEIPQFYFCNGRYSNYVIRFENLQEGFDEVCRRLRLPGSSLLRIESEVGPQ